jgi:hypothetical protein
MISNSTLSSLTYNGIKWSVRNSIMRKNNQKNQKNNTITKFTFNCLETMKDSGKNKINKVDMIINVNK